MKRILIAILLLVLVTTACAPVQEASVAPSAEEIQNAEPDPVEQGQSPAEAPTSAPEPTAALAPTETPIPTPEPGFQPYATDFSDAVEDWEVVMAKETTAVSLENGQYILEASGISATVVSSPKSILDASEITIEVDVSFSNEGEAGGAGIVCGYGWEKAFFGLGIKKLGKAYHAAISQTTTQSTLSSLVSVELPGSRDQQTYRLKAICSTTGLGLMVDGKQVLSYPAPDFRPGRIGLYSEGGWGINSNATATVDVPNTAIFDNFLASDLQTQDEWAGGSDDPLEFLSIGEVLFNEDFSSPNGTWSIYANAGATAKFENGKLSLTNTSDDVWAYSKLESFTGFTSGVMMETDFTFLPGASEGKYVGFICDIDGNWNNLYEFHLNGMGGSSYFKYSNGAWKGLGSFDPINESYAYLEPGRTYRMTGICGGGYLALLIDGVSAYFVPIAEQNFHSVGLSGGLADLFEGEVTIEFDNFKITRIDPK